MSKVRIYKVPSAAEKAAIAEAEERRYASMAEMSLEQWRGLDDNAREEMRAAVDKMKANVRKSAMKHDRNRAYASKSGMTLDEWNRLKAKDRREKVSAIKAAEKSERAARRERAAIEKLKSDAQKAVRRKNEQKAPSGGLPGATRLSTITGLQLSPTNKKWNMFLKDGPYWNYLVYYIRRLRIFPRREDLVEESVMNTCEKLAKFLVARGFKYKEEGKGFFRGFLQVVAKRTALDLLKDIRRQEQVFVRESESKHAMEFEKIHDDMLKAAGRCRRRLEKDGSPVGLESEIPPATDRDLDIYDASAGFGRDIPKAERRHGKMHDIARLDEDPFSDDEPPSSYVPADLFVWKENVPKKELRWVQTLQLHVLYIALGHVLSNEKMSADSREMLRLRYGMDMPPKEIYKLPRFAGKSRDAFDVQMSRATDVLRKEASSWWQLVAPDKNDFANETVLRFWRELGRGHGRGKLANDLQDKAIKLAGRIE